VKKDPAENIVSTLQKSIDKQRVVWHVQRLFVYDENEVYYDDYFGNEEGIK